MELIRLGTKYGGWIIPKDHGLTEDSIVYSAGVGEDISFDLLLGTLTKSKIYLIDPTTRAYTHFNECKTFFTENKNESVFSGDIQKDYSKVIRGLHPNLSNFEYINCGLWEENTTLKFFKPTNPKYVSHSLIEGMQSANYDLVPVKTIQEVMKNFGHEKIDLLKLDIEGAEIKVIHKMLNDNILPRILCIEFDLYIKKMDKNNETIGLIRRLESLGYKCVANESMNLTFVKR